jgi:acyl-coenzyme A synthetase/AMP-(fatty) acid ligase/thioesterase domain-containing protein
MEPTERDAADTTADNLVGTSSGTMAGTTVGSSADPAVDAQRRVRDVARTDPDRLAIDDDQGDAFTYAELDRLADRLARGLVERLGPRPHPVAIRLNSLRDLAVCSVAIDRAGMISVAVDPSAPAERARAVLEDVGAPLLLVDTLGDGLPEWPTSTVADASSVGDDAEPFEVERATDIASIVFTSGSTGVPKGIVFDQGYKNFWGRWLLTKVEPGIRVGVLSAGTVSFVESFVQAALILGGTMVPYEIRSLGFGPMGAWFDDKRVQGFGCVPTVLRFLLPTLPEDHVFRHLQIVASTGETMTWEDVAALRPHLRPDAVVHNFYGTTESGPITELTIDANTPLGTGPLPAGRPLLTAELHVVDEVGEDVPAGSLGEVAVVSRDVALGYWRRPDLSARAFQSLPDGRRRCLTGDSGRIRPDGLLELHGRLDHVVKVSGNRIDLGELESVLRTLDGVAAVAAAPRADANGDVRLCAYVVKTAGSSIGTYDVRAALVRRLPGYMQPHRIVFLDSLPMLPNGKVDRQRLPDPADADAVATNGDAPSGLEQSLTAIWREVLDLPSIGRDETFFDLGGDSMRAGRMFAEIERRLGLRRPVSLLLEAPTVALLAKTLERAPIDGDVLVPIRTEGDRPPLFVIHGGGGEILWARHIADGLRDDQPVYGLQPPELDATPDIRTVGDLSRLYLDVISVLCAGAPPLLYGYSYGGVVALEMAVELQRRGGDVGLLAIGDTALVLDAGVDHDPDAVAPRRNELSQLRRVSLRKAAVRAFSMAVRDPKSAVAFLRRYRRTPAWQRIIDRTHADISRELWRLVKDYRPEGRYVGRVLVLRSEDTRALPDLGWSAVIDGPIEVVDVPGRHGDLAKPPHVAEVAAALQRAILGSANRP